nr:poly(R)-hydroxyalkanoic acid synthase subunit PhaE [Desulfosarcina alkanivorans]
MFSSWMKSMNTFWGSLDGKPAAAQTEPQPAPSKTQEAMAAAFKNWQKSADAMATPESMTALFKGSGAVPEVLLGLAQSTMSSLVELQKNMFERLGRMGESVKAYQFQDIDENINRIWADIYEKEFRQFFQIPQLGLMRTYQEKASQVADKYNLYQSTLSEFLSLLGMPFTRTVQVMQEKINEMAESDELPDDPKMYYNMWVKVLEGHFMTLFQTPEYVDTLTRTVNSLADFAAARDAAIEDALSLLPVAKKTDMDEMAQELYELKKRLKKLEKLQKTTR